MSYNLSLLRRNDESLSWGPQNWLNNRLFTQCSSSSPYPVTTSWQTFMLWMWIFCGYVSSPTCIPGSVSLDSGMESKAFFQKRHYLASWYYQVTVMIWMKNTVALINRSKSILPELSLIYCRVPRLVVLISISFTQTPSWSQRTPKNSRDLHQFI